MERTGYRSDVDGLRGVAILSVLLFHFRLAAVPGGFIGVDIFFVISGYLITRNIYSDIRAGTWSFGRFYIRRVRRLFPALFATLVLCFIAASVLLMPNEFEWFTTTALHSIASTSNFLYWQALGYFGPTAERTALLHTWSLSVEEQFYLVWPLLMLLVLGRARRGPATLIAVFVVAGALSVWAGQWALTHDPQAGFYLMPFRVVEFAAGGLLIWLPRLPARLAWLEEALLIAGLGLLAWCLAAYYARMPFPGVSVLAPTIGAALAIYAGQARFSGALLRQPWLVWIGVISYSLYLVHWPLLVFSEFALLRRLEPAELPLLIAAAIGLAWLMVRFIERPFRTAPRRPSHLQPAAFGLACAGLTVVFMWTGATVLASNGWPWRVPESIRVPIAGLAFANDARGARLRTGVCHMNMVMGLTATGGLVDERCLQPDPARPNVLVFGDSHAADRYGGLVAAFPEVNFLQTTTAACRPILDTPFREYHCRERLDWVFNEFLPRQPIDAVILTGRWQAEDLEPLGRTIAYLRGLAGVRGRLRVIVLGPAVEFMPRAADLVFHHRRAEGLSELVSRFQVPERKAMDAQVRAVAEANGAEFFSAIDAFCPAGLCPVLSADGTTLLVVDEGHQSPPGMLIQAQGFRAQGLSFVHQTPVAAGRSDVDTQAGIQPHGR